jgi:SapC
LIYERPIPLKGDVLKQRIFSPLAYPNVRNANVIAITAHEAPRYAPHFPIAWAKREHHFELVIIRSLLPDGRGHPEASQTALPFLPALCRAYPFMYAPVADDSKSSVLTGRRSNFFDAAVADAPTDVGAPICFADGRPTKATAQRIALLDSAAPLFDTTAAVTVDLAALDLFEAWPLRFENIEGHTLDVPDLWIVKQDAVLTGALAPLMRTHGLIAADLISLHRISLFRAGIVLANAKTALRAGQPVPDDTQTPAIAGADAPR